MVNSLVRKQLESLLATFLPPKTQIKSSTLLQAYATFTAISSKKDENFSTAYAKIRAETNAYPYGILRISGPISSSAPLAFRHFLSLDPENFLRFIVSDMVSNPSKLLQIFQKKRGNNLPLLAHYIILIKLTSFNLTSGTATATSTKACSYDDILKKIYDIYCSCEVDKSVQFPYSDFIEFYKLINLYPLDPNEYGLTHRGYNPSKLNRTIDILSNHLELSREQQFEVLKRYFLKNESSKQIVDQFPPYHFAKMQSPSERKEAMQKALILLSEIPPFDALCAISIYKKHSSSYSLSSVIKNDVPLENGLIYSLFTTRTLLDLEPDKEILIFNPSPFFAQKWLKDSATKNKKVSFIFPNSNISEIINYHFREGTYAIDPGKKVSFLSFEQWQEQLNRSPSESRLSHSKILLFACGMSLSAQTSWYQLIKKNVVTSADIFILLSSYEFDHAHSPFSSELDDPHMNILTVETIPQGINNSTSPRRKIFIHCFYNTEESFSFGTTKVSAFTLNTDLKMQALSKMFDDPVEIDQHNLVGLYCSIRELYQRELLTRKATGRKNVAAISHEFTPDITIWCSKTYPPNNKNRPRLEAYVCSPGDPKRIENGFRDRGTIIEETKKHTVRIPDQNISSWLDSVYPFSSVHPRRPSDKPSEGISRKPSICIREQIIDKYTPYLAGKNIALKTFWYLYPNLENLYSAKDYATLSQMACSEIGFLRLDHITPSVCEDMLVTCFPDDSRENLLRRIGILSTALNKAVEYSFCNKNLLYQTIHEQHLRDKLFSQVRNALTKKHFTEAELLKAFEFVDQKIQAGELEYLGVMIRLLTGLDSNTICALKWKDIQEITDYKISKIIITRQVTNDGKETKGFDSLEDYLCFPCSLLLKKFLDNQYSQTKLLIPSFSNLEDCSIVNSRAAILDARNRYAAFPPRELEKLCKETIMSVGIEDRIIEIPDSEKGTKETNLNRYQGDFFRENFRHWALTRAKLTSDETLYLLGNKPETTFGIYYCDFLNDASQLMIFVKLLRWDAVFAANNFGYAQTMSISATQFFQQDFLPITNNPLHIHMRLLMQNAGQFTLRTESQYGMSVLIAPIMPEPEGG